MESGASNCMMKDLILRQLNHFIILFKSRLKKTTKRSSRIQCILNKLIFDYNN